MACTACAIWDEQYLAYDFGDHPTQPRAARSDDPAGACARRARPARGASRRAPPTSRSCSPSTTPTTSTRYARPAPTRTSAATAWARRRPGVRRHVRRVRADRRRLGAGGRARVERQRRARGQHRRRPAPRDARLAPRLLRLQRRRARDPHAARRRARSGSPTSTSTCTTATGCRPPSTTTRGCSRSACTRTRARSSRAPGSPTRSARGAAEGTSVNLALPPGTGDDGWLRAFRAVVPGAVRAFRPDVLVTQCGCDTHHEDPLADLELSVDGQRAAIGALHRAGARGRPAAAGWRSAAAATASCAACRAPGRTCSPRPPASRSTRTTEIPAEWTDAPARPRARAASCRDRWARARSPAAERVEPGGDRWLDRAIAATRARRASRCSASIRTTPVTDPRDGPERPTSARRRRRTGRPTSSSPTAARCTCGRSGPTTPTRWSPSTRGLSHAHPLPALLLGLPAHPRARPAPVHQRRPPRPGRVGRDRSAGEIIAVGRYEREPGTDEAEVAFVVADAHQGRGIGSVLLEHLAAAARETRHPPVPRRRARREHRRCCACSATPATRPRATSSTARSASSSTIDETAVTEAVMREREQRAEARSIARLLYPRSVAVVGASNEPGKIGHAVFANLLRHAASTARSTRSTREARHVGGVPAYRSVLDVPGERRPRRRRRARRRGAARSSTQCARRGVRGLVVISRRLRRAGHRRRARRRAAQAQRALVTEARANGMRVRRAELPRHHQHRLRRCGSTPRSRRCRRCPDGPASSASPARSASPCSARPRGAALGRLDVRLGRQPRRRVGQRPAAVLGDRPSTPTSCCMYLESFGNPRKFARLARRLGRTKPIVAVNSGAGTVVPGLAGDLGRRCPTTAARALFERSGVIRVDTVGDLFDVALLLTSQPLPAGSRVAVVGNSTALGRARQECLRCRGVVARPRSTTSGSTRRRTSSSTSLRDVLADDGGRRGRGGVRAAAAAGQRRGRRARAAPRRGRARPSRCVSTFLGFEGVPGLLAARGETLAGAGVGAVLRLAGASGARAWRGRCATRRGGSRPRGTVPEPVGLDLDAARALVDAVLADAPAGTGAGSRRDRAAAGRGRPRSCRRGADRLGGGRHRHA